MKFACIFFFFFNEAKQKHQNQTNKQPQTRKENPSKTEMTEAVSAMWKVISERPFKSSEW